MSVFYKNTCRVLFYDVLQQQKTGVMTKGVVSGEGLTSSPAYNVEPVTNTLSPSCVNNWYDRRRGVLDARRRPSRLCFSQFATRTVDNTVDLYAAKPDIRPEPRFLLIQPEFDASVSGGGVPIAISLPRLVWKN